MNWTTINEYLNLTAIVTSLIPLSVGIKKYSYSKQAKLILLYLLLGLILDSTTFCIYKFLHKNSIWLTPFYYLNFFVILSLALYYFLKKELLGKIIIYAIIAGVILLTIRLIFYNGLNAYDNIAWFTIQSYYVILCPIIFYSQIKRATINPFKNSLFLLAIAIFINCLLPLLSNLLQYEFYDTSPEYFQIALMFLNISSIIANLFFAKSLQYITPTATPKPSQLLRGQN